jgi:outer membrane protein TolC
MRKPVRLSTALRQAARGIPAALLLVLPLAASAQLPLSTAVDLAQKHSPKVRTALADVQRAQAGLHEAHAVYVPNFSVGASPGYAYGYPLGYPSLFNMTSSSLVFSFSQPDYVRSAHTAVKAAQLNLKDAQQQAALNVSLDYVELDHDLRMIAALNQEKNYADRLAGYEQDRVTAGVDPRVNLLQAQLASAQVDEKRIHLENDAAEMRQKIGNLTGLPAEGLTTVSSSIPSVPAFDAAEVASNPGIAAAYANAKSKFFMAFGDAKANYRPMIGFGAQYSLFSKFNNYNQYFKNFQYNNVELGVQITLPLFDATKRAKAQESAAAAAAAQATADESRDELSEADLKLRRTVRELQAQQKVAHLQSELAQAQLQTIESEMTSGSGGAQPATPIQEQKARIQERERYEDLLDANFSLLQAQLHLLRNSGQILAWAESSH